MKGTALRKLRLAQKLSVAKAAQLVGVSHRTWVRWETLKAIPEPAAKLVSLLWPRQGT
jgi:transcriptional regulator with XRE-family HTH domain